MGMNGRGRWLVLGLVAGLILAGGAAIVLSGGMRALILPADSGSTQAVVRAEDWPSLGLPARLQPTPSPLPRDLIDQVDAEYALLGNVYERTALSVVNIDVLVSFQEQFDAEPVGSGSGFVYDQAGHIVTNSHVVRDADGIQVTFRDGYVTEAELVGIDDFSDLAVIRVDVAPERLLPVTLGSIEGLYVGQRVIAIGNPFGLESSLTVGVISALGRTLPSAELLDPTQQPFKNPAIIQVDAEINPGNSGGPLLNTYGEVIGINTAIRTESGTFQGVGFAVPISTVRRVVPELIETGQVAYSWLGISALSPEGGYSLAGMAEALDLPVSEGVLIQQITPGSPAEAAGLRGGVDTGQVIRGQPVLTGGDIIVAIDGVPVESMDGLVDYLVVNTRPDDSIVMTVIRDGETLDVTVHLGSRANAPDTTATIEPEP